jgi:hypothetical protein
MNRRTMSNVHSSCRCENISDSQLIKFLHDVNQRFIKNHPDYVPYSKRIAS